LIYIPFKLHPFLVFRLFNGLLSKSLSTHRTNLSLKVIVDDRWYFGVSADLLLCRISAAVL
jgi:hypothetical protein